jgi:hypothetical protein
MKSHRRYISQILTSALIGETGVNILGMHERIRSERNESSEGYEASCNP